MVDLTKITTPFGLLDEETQEALKTHGGPYECYLSSGWESDGRFRPSWSKYLAYRVKPEPPKPREWWISSGTYAWNTKEEAVRYGGENIVHVREVLE